MYDKDTFIVCWPIQASAKSVVTTVITWHLQYFVTRADAIYILYSSRMPKLICKNHTNRLPELIWDKQVTECQSLSALNILADCLS